MLPAVAMLAFPIAKREGKVIVTDLVKAGVLMECVAETHGSLGLLQVRLLCYAQHEGARMTRFLKRG